MCANTDTGKVSRSNPRTANSFTHGISTAIVKCLAQTVCTPNTVNGVEIKRKKTQKGRYITATMQHPKHSNWISTEQKPNATSPKR